MTTPIFNETDHLHMRIEYEAWHDTNAALADATGLDLRPSPPVVMTDMAGALLDVVSADILLTQDETYLAETTFSAEDREISGVFFVMPSEELRDALLSAERAA